MTCRFNIFFLAIPLIVQLLVYCGKLFLLKVCVLTLYSEKKWFYSLFLYLSTGGNIGCWPDEKKQL